MRLQRKRIYTFKDKEKVRKWAITEGRKVLWCDSFDVWHAAMKLENAPLWAKKVEKA